MAENKRASEEHRRALNHVYDQMDLNRQATLMSMEALRRMGDTLAELTRDCRAHTDALFKLMGRFDGGPSAA